MFPEVVTELFHPALETKCIVQPQCLENTQFAKESCCLVCSRLSVCDSREIVERHCPNSICCGPVRVYFEKLALEKSNIDVTLQCMLSKSLYELSTYEGSGKCYGGEHGEGGSPG